MPLCRLDYNMQIPSGYFQMRTLVEDSVKLDGNRCSTAISIPIPIPVLLIPLFGPHASSPSAGLECEAA